MFISFQDKIINTDYIKEIHAADIFHGDYDITILYIDGTKTVIEFDEAIECEMAEEVLHNQLGATQIDPIDFEPVDKSQVKPFTFPTEL
jgi:hypothetical protein